MNEKLPFSDLKRTQASPSTTPKRETRPNKRSKVSVSYFIWMFLKAAIFSALPFIILIRGAVYLHENYHFLPWLALLGGMIGSAAILVVYFAYIQYKWGGSFKFSIRRKSFIALVLVMVYCVPAVFYLNPVNAKYEEVQSEFTSLHPILRLGVSTLIFLDKDLLITDANRKPEDYKKMGLATKKHSLHYPQSNGYAHAIDLRTNGRSELRNWLVKQYFAVMGFNTLRHVGTADHLHISVFSHDRPNAI